MLKMLVDVSSVKNAGTQKVIEMNKNHLLKKLRRSISLFQDDRRLLVKRRKRNRSKSNCLLITLSSNISFYNEWLATVTLIARSMSKVLTRRNGET